MICTRNRPAHLQQALDALDRQSFREFPVAVIDQSDESNPDLERLQAVDARLSVILDRGQGLSRSRNIGWRHARSEWVAFVDDDCRPEPDWAQQLQRKLAAHPEVDFVGVHVGERSVPDDDYVPVATHSVDEEALYSGRWTQPNRLGFGVCMAVRRSTIERLGGWDERLGPGVVDFPAADDMDFNYRLLRAGSTALVTPDVRVFHDQWRTKQELGPLLCGYMAAHCGFSIKHLRTGDLAGGIWLWGLGLTDLLRMVASGTRRRSPFRLRLAGWKLRGLMAGTQRALAVKW